MSAIVMLVDRSGNSVGALDSASVQQVQWNLNDPHTAQIQVPTLDPVGVGIELMRSEIQIWINGYLEFWGFPETMSGNSQLVSFNLVDLLGYMKYRFITNTSLIYTSVEQLDIAANLVAQMQGGTHQSFNIGTATYSPSGHIRSRDYDIKDHKNALDLLKEFPGLDDGFDFSVECTDAYGVPARLFTPWYPSKGSFKPNYTLEWGKNIISVENWAEDGTKLATLDYCTGGTNTAGDKVENHYEDTAASAYYGQYQAITADGSEIDPAWLLAKATQEVANRNKPQLAPGMITVGSDSSNLVHNLKVGDTIPVYVDLGRIQIIGDTFRVIRAIYKGDGTYTLTLARLPVAFSPPSSGIVQ